VQSLALQFITAWALCGQEQRSRLSALGLAPALARLAMEAVGQGEQGRQLQADVCRWVAKWCSFAGASGGLLGCDASFE